MQLRRIVMLLVLCGLTALTAAVLGSRPDPAAAHHVTAISLGGQHSCALTTAGGVQCWGRDQFGQLGDGNDGDDEGSGVPVDVVGLESGVTAIASGATHTCAVTSAGGVKCWGNNEIGQLGNGASGEGVMSTAPVDVVGLDSGVGAVAAGFAHTCALMTAGNVQCWGSNWHGELGAPTTGTCVIDLDGYQVPCSPTPVEVVEEDFQPLTGAVAITSGGGFRTCVLTTAGGVKCWPGTGGSGCVLTPAGDYICWGIPQEVAGLESGVAAVSSGERHACALTTAGGVKCWGENWDGQLGDGQGCGFVCDTPVEVCASGEWDPVAHQCLDSGEPSPLTGAAAVEAGGLHTCALMISGGVKCWGFDAFGQVDGTGGLGPGNDHTIPVDAPAPASGVIAISAGGYHTCALIDTGAVTCWGGDDYGQTGDTDGDGCTDFAEHGSDPMRGGLRDHTSYWDFFDTPIVGNTRDRTITIGDIGAVVGRFGAFGDAEGDPRSEPPPPPSYHAAFDRGGQAGEHVWDQAPANGSISVGDIGAVVAQFGHGCG